MSDELDKISDLLDKGDLDGFTEMKESYYLEAKGAVTYDLDSAADRYELAKDVSAFANASGGYLIIGLTTERLAEELTDKISALDLVKSEAFDEGKYRGIIDTNIYPRIHGLTVKWMHKKDEDMGVGVICIPEQKEDKKYFLIKNIIEEGEEIKQIVFGIAIRKGSHNIPFAVEALHKAVLDGRRKSNQTIRRIEEKLDILLRKQAEPSPEVPATKLDARIEAFRNESD